MDSGHFAGDGTYADEEKKKIRICDQTNNKAQESEHWTQARPIFIYQHFEDGVRLAIFGSWPSAMIHSCCMHLLRARAVSDK